MSTVFDRTASVQSLPPQARPQAATGRGARQAVVTAVAVALLVAGCAGMDDTQRRTAAGAGIGAAVGAALGGNAAGGKGVRNGALIGRARWKSRSAPWKRPRPAPACR